MNKTFFILLLTTVLTAAGIPAAAQSVYDWWDSPSALPSDYMEDGYLLNPTAFSLLTIPRQLSLSARYDAGGAQNLHSLFQGNGLSVFRLGASGYSVEQGKSIYSGEASFESGVERNVGWTDARHVEMLYPYLVADSVGGDYHHETYRLSGSYSRYFDAHAVGMRIAYEGEVAYRPRDPRSKNTSSTLNLNPGAMFALGKNDYLGVFFDYMYYKQHVSVSVEEPNKKHVFYILKGMGLYDNRFTEADNAFARYYRSNQYKAGVQFAHKGAHYVSAQLHYALRTLEVEESDYRVPFTVKAYTVGASLLWQAPLGKDLFSLKATGELYSHRGTERTYEKVQGGSQNNVTVWKFLSESEKHDMTRINGGLNLLYEQSVSQSLTLWYALDGQVQYEKEEYLYPSYHQRVSSLYGTAAFGLKKHFGRKWFEAQVSGTRKQNLGHDLSAPSSGLPVQKMLLPEYDFKRSSFSQATARLSLGIPLTEKIALSFFADGGYGFAESENYRWQGSGGACVYF